MHVSWSFDSFLVSDLLWLTYSASKSTVNDSSQPSVDHMLWWVESLSTISEPSGIMLTKQSKATKKYRSEPAATRGGFHLSCKKQNKTKKWGQLNFPKMPCSVALLKKQYLLKSVLKHVTFKWKLCIVFDLQLFEKFIMQMLVHVFTYSIFKNPSWTNDAQTCS